jgi:putative GTP pyrophosphokinase
MVKDVVGEILREYDDQFPVYNAFTDKVNGLVGELLKDGGLRVHSITSRLKAKDTLRDKLSRAEEDYSKLSDVTDICGLRIITYFADEVDAVARVIEQEFEIDAANSVDKRVLLDPDRFGYLSLHYVSKLSHMRLKLVEYRRFVDCKVEIQIRSILQHTWAEIEHDIGYKSKQSIPKEVRRRFSRLAGLLEIADSEFAQIRNDLEHYAEAVPQRISDAPELVSIDRASLFAFVKENRTVLKLDREIAASVKASLVEDRQWLEGLVNNLHYVGLETIADVVTNWRISGIGRAASYGS